MTLLRLVGVAVELGGRRVLHDVDLDFHRGDIVGLLGPNGAGKTTLLRSVLGLVPLAAGEIRIDGRPPARARELFGYVPQHHTFAWDFPITVSGAVMTGRIRVLSRLRGPSATDRDRVDRALDRVGLRELASRPIGELSGGQRQRVLLARALVTDPQALLLDEPFTGVDAPTQRVLSEVLRRLAEDRRAVIMSTHDIGHARALCDRLVLLNGTVTGDGPPDDVSDTATLLTTFAGGAA